MLASVRLTRSTTNEAIANYLTQAGHLENIETALDTSRENFPSYILCKYALTVY